MRVLSYALVPWATATCGLLKELVALKGWLEAIGGWVEQDIEIQAARSIQRLGIHDDPGRNGL